MATLRFLPAGEAVARSVPLSPVTTILVAIMKIGAPIRHDCGGRAQCGTCRVEASSAEGLSPMGVDERARLSALGLPVDGSLRLACRTYASRDVEARGCLGRKDGQS
ncbi:MAG TPA: 2Fe-2S iron-sulfur cluster-binding protein [Rectinemataceae bacterium]|nr:2Fe-2S iron-sulfur cluster-binding protein [Rectinemataceae bacterium]